MRFRSFTLAWLVRRGATLACLIAAAVARGANERAGDAPLFAGKIKPILEANCFKCHAGGKAKGGLSLATREGILKGGEQGPAVNLDKPEESLVLQMLSYKDGDHQMPPNGKLPQEQIDLIAEWIKLGLPMEGGTEPSPTTPAPVGNVQEKPDPKSHWAFQPVKRPGVPHVADSGWQENPIDAFIRKKLEEKGFDPAPPASREVLIRRAAYDLTGLPPSPERVREFAADSSPDAYEKLIEELLVSPHYGEKWGRQWLDVVRYAETNGYERDGKKPYVWKYRDYVINAFNNDKAYDQFIREQIAGDELPGAGAEQIIATGYYRLGIWDDEPADKDQGTFDTLDGIVDTTGQAFLGLTMGCARCHDHKIDPIPQKDYYGMLSFFRGMTEMQRNDPNAVVRSILPPEAQIEYDLQAAAKQAKVKELGERIGKIESEFKTRLDAEKKADELRAAIAGAALPAADPAAPQPELADLMKQRGLDLLGPEEMAYYNQLKGEFAAANARVIPGGDWALAIEEVGPAPPETHILLRGNPHVPGDPAEPCFPSIIAPEAPKIPPADPGAKTAGRRRYLADWIASADNRLTARVMVNRIWQGHFGRGIVRSSNNFGLGGDPPTHPELLDWLASEFIRRGWSVKAMHRLIMTSRAYQMSSRAGAKELAADPNNDFFWRFDMRRLQAEEIRDAILAVTGDINLKVGGESVFPKMPEAVLATSSTPKLVWGNSPEEERNRRSVYIHLKRSLLTPLLAEFDLADTDSSCPVRFVTTQPTQALGLLNGEFITEEAARFAGRIRRESGDDIEGGVRRAISLVTCRDAQPAEIGEAMKFIRELEEKDGLPAEKALERFCLLALNLNEFIYLD